MKIIENEIKEEFYKQNGRYPGEIWTPLHTVTFSLYLIGGILLGIEIIISNIK